MSKQAYSICILSVELLVRKTGSMGLSHLQHSGPCFKLSFALSFPSANHPFKLDAGYLWKTRSLVGLFRRAGVGGSSDSDQRSYLHCSANDQLGRPFWAFGPRSVDEGTFMVDRRAPEKCWHFFRVGHFELGSGPFM